VSTLQCSGIHTIGILYDHSHTSNLFLVDAPVVDVTRQGARGVLV
jgi:hypothetical protein